MGAISETWTEAEAFVIGESATKEIKAGAELGEQLLLQNVTGLMARGVDKIELDMDEGADVAGRATYLTFEHYEATIIEGSKGADAIGVVALVALHL